MLQEADTGLSECMLCFLHESGHVWNPGASDLWEPAEIEKEIEIEIEIDREREIEIEMEIER